MYTLKCHLIVYPQITVLTLYGATIMTAGYLIRIFEKPYFRKSGVATFDSYFESIWFTVVTQTTIGYGDISPGTKPGKITVMFLALWGTLLTSLLVVTVSSIFQMNNNQEMALRHVKLTRTAANAICTGIEYFQAKKKLHLLQNKMHHTEEKDNGANSHSHHHCKSKFLDIMEKSAKPLRAEQA